MRENKGCEEKGKSLGPKSSTDDRLTNQIDEMVLLVRRQEGRLQMRCQGHGEGTEENSAQLFFKY